MASESPQAKNRRLQKSYGITLTDYNEMLEAQQGKCAVCGNPFSLAWSESPAVDHDHDSGKVRALVCVRDNLLLGQGLDDWVRMFDAATYLRKHKGGI